MGLISKALSHFHGANAAKAHRMPEPSSTLEMNVMTGTHNFTIANYSSYKSCSYGLKSAMFTVGNHEWYIVLYPNAVRQKQECASIYVCRNSVASEVKAQFTVMMIDCDGNPLKKSYTSRIHDFKKMASPGVENVNKRCVQWIVKKKRLEKSKYLRDDSCTIWCTINVITGSRSRMESSKCSIMVPPSKIVQNLSNLLDSGNGADVTFLVSGQDFPAHKWLLAERSPVFRAELFGPMMENGMKIITLNDIEAPVFQMLLRFIYTDTVPEFANCQNNKQELVAIAQHLLVAGDRYGIERLKLMCEEKLSKHVNAANVVTTLVLAEQHNCPQLKATCLALMASPKVLACLMASDGFEHLKKNCPSVIKELQELIGSS